MRKTDSGTAGCLRYMAPGTPNGVPASAAARGEVGETVLDFHEIEDTDRNINRTPRASATI